MPVQFFINKMVQHSVADCGLMNITWFGIRDVECRIRTMHIRLIFEVHVEARNIRSELSFKFNDIFITSFASQKLLPRQE